MLNAVLIVIDVATSLGLIFLILLHSGRGGGLSDICLLYTSDAADE